MENNGIMNNELMIQYGHSSWNIASYEVGMISMESWNNQQSFDVIKFCILWINIEILIKLNVWIKL